jgi:hypothetical protein
MASILGRSLVRQLASLHPQPERLTHDLELGELLLDLYDADSAEEVWMKQLLPFIRFKSVNLRAIYARHSVLPVAPCLDQFEGLLVIERIHNDRGRLKQAWPYQPGELEAVAEAVGMRLSFD